MLKRLIWAIGVLLSGMAGAGDSEVAFRWLPSVDQADSSPLGEALPGSEFLLSDGRRIRPAEVAEGSPLLIVVRDPDCPVSRRYGPTLQRLERQLPLLYLLPGELAGEAVAARDRKRYGLNAPHLFDPQWQLSRWLGVQSTGDVFLFDARGVLRYRGAIDDQYGIGFSRAAPTRTFLADALDALRNRRAVKVQATVAPGCVLGPPETQDAMTRDLAWNGRISRLLQAKCQVCHRPGQAGPFPLETYPEVYPRRWMIRFVLENRIMPPWFAAGDASRWQGGRQLADADRQAIVDWIDAGAPEGDPATAPPPVDWHSGWQGGEPDAVLTAPRELHIPAEGDVAYQYVELPTAFGRDRWVKAIEIQSDRPQNAHHILAFLLPPAPPFDPLRGLSPDAPLEMTPLERNLLATKGFFGAYVAGTSIVRYPAGVAKLLPAGWRILLQIHYEPNGESGHDRPRLGLYFAQGDPVRRLHTLAASQLDLRIPPNAPHHHETASLKFDKAGQLLGFFPHMHLRGRAFRYRLQTADGHLQTLLDVPRYDPNWQLYYQLRKPIPVSAGSRLLVDAWFDNSAANPNNPDPRQEVRFGLKTEDEMLIGYFDWLEESE